MNHRVRPAPHDRLRRADVLRAASARLDEAAGRGPAAEDLLGVALGTPGVPEAFVDEVDVVGGLLLRRHARLTAELDRALSSQPRDLARAVELGWAATARGLPGIGALLDQQRGRPATPALEQMLRRADGKEHARLAQAAGLSSLADPRLDPAAEQVGGRLVRRARALVHQDEADRVRTGPRRVGTAVDQRVARPKVGASPRFVQRIRALLAA